MSVAVADAMSPLVTVIQTPVTGEPGECERCPHLGNVGVYWIPCGAQCGYLRVCECCVVEAVEIALDDAPADGVVTVELEVYSDACGSFAGYQRHIRRKDTPCCPCRAANNDYQADRRDAVSTTGTLVPLRLLGRLLQAAGEIDTALVAEAARSLGPRVLRRAQQAAAGTPLKETA